MPFEYVHYLVAFEVHHDRGGAVASAKTEVVHANNAHIPGVLMKSPSDTVQESVGAYEEADFAGKPRSRLATQGEGYPLQSLPLTVSAAGEGQGHLL